MMFDLVLLFVILFITIYLFRKKIFLGDLFSRFFFGLIIFFLLLYIGIGGALKEMQTPYVMYYIGYLLALFVGVQLFTRKNVTCVVDESVYVLFIKRYARVIIVLYSCLSMFDLFYPEIKLMNLIHPPMPDLKDFFIQRFNQNENSLLKSIVIILKNLLEPFFYFSLYFYRNKIWKIGLILLLIIYFEYCGAGYIGRSKAMINLILFVSLTYIWCPKWRKKIVILVLFFTPLLFVILANYAVMRIGGSVGATSIADAGEKIILGESNYPLWFNDIYIRNNDFSDVIDYIYWFVTLPLPVVPTFSNIDFGLNYKISEFLLGIPRGENGFYVLLPGLVGEGYYIFGKLFWIHGFVYGSLIGCVYSYLRKSNCLLPLGLFVALIIGYAGSRGGTPSAYPLVMKQLFYFVIVLKLYAMRPIKFTLNKT